MKLNLIQRRTFTVTSARALVIISLGALGTARPTSAAPIDWRGGDLFWSTPGNWSPLGPPGTNDDVRFFDPGAAIDTATINNSVSSDITVRSLWFGNTNGFHNMSIEPGVTLTVRGTNDNGYGRLGSDPNATAPNPNVQSTLYVGTKSEVAVNTVVTANIRGDGTLRLDNTNNEVNVRQAWGAGGGAHRSVLDMSGLGTFVANLSRIRVGDGEAGAIRRTEGQLILAKTNRITLSGPSVAEDVQLLVGNADVNNNGNGSISYLVLGQDNVLNVDHVLVGARKQQGNIHFLETLSGPSLIMRGSDGLSRVTALRIGDESDQANSGNPTAGRIDLNSGTADIRADTIIVGKGQQQTGREAIGFLTLGPGSLDVNTIELAYQTSETANNRVDGTATFNGTAVKVNNMLRLGRSAGAPFPRNAVLNINGGSVTVANSLVTEGTATINVTNGLLALSGGSPVQATTLVIDGGVVSNASTINVTNSLRVANFGSILGNPIYDLGNSGSATWDVQAINGGALTVSNALRGSGTVIGDLIQAPGAAISPGGDGTVGRLSIQAVTLGGNLTSEGGTLAFDLSADALGTNDQIVINGALQLNATNDVKLTALSGGFDAFNPYTLITSGFLAGDQNYFRISGALAQSRYTFTFDTSFIPNSVLLFVGGSGSANLTWVGDGSANRWDLKGAANWTLGGPSAEQFYSLDAVTFNDFGSVSPAVALVGTLNPGAITVDNPTKNYAFGGAGGVQGAPLTKQGAGALIFNNTGDNSFGGTVTIWDGAVTFSNAGLNTFVNGLAINGGNLTLTGNNANNITGGELSIAAGASLTAANASGNDFGSALINLDGTLTVNQAADSTLNGSLTGGGTLIKAGNGTLTLAKDNSALSSVIQINGGTIKAGAPNSLGITGVAIANGATLNLNGLNLGALPVTVSGPGAGNNGALVNTAAPQVNALANVTLQGNTTFGGSGPWNTDPVLNRGRWDIRNGSLNTLGQAVNLTKVGSNQVTLAGTTVDPALADIDVQQGLLAFEGNTTSMGEPSSILTVRVGATISFFDTTTAWNKKFILFGNNVTPTLLNWNGANTIAGPITLNGNCVVGGVPSDRGTPVSLTLSGPIDGGGGLTKVSADRLVLSGSYTYGGETDVNAGTLALADDGSIPNSPQISIQAGAIVDVTGTFGGALTLVGGQWLQGNGSIIGNLIAGAGSTVSPGLRSRIGDLTVTGDISLQGTTVMELNAALDTNDVLRGASIAFAGTLRSENLAGTLGAGDSFKVFDAAFYSGSFATIIPATPGAGLVWDVSTLGIDGTLRVKPGQQQPQIATTQLFGGALIFGGGGGTPNAAYYVLSSTNLSASPIVWTRILTNNFDASGNFSVTNIVNINTRQRFFILEVP